MVYILMFCLRGSLPWQGVLKLSFLQADNLKEKLLHLRDTNLMFEIPLELKSLLQYAWSLEFEAAPDYERIETILTLIKEKHKFVDGYEWKIKHEEIKVPAVLE